MKNLGIIGSRTFDNAMLFNEVMRSYSPDLIVSGGAKGADSLAKDYAEKHGIELREILPDYKTYNGKKTSFAPIIRNKDIVNASDGILAFWDQK